MVGHGSAFPLEAFGTSSKRRTAPSRQTIVPGGTGHERVRRRRIVLGVDARHPDAAPTRFADAWGRGIRVLD